MGSHDENGFLTEGDVLLEVHNLAGVGKPASPTEKMVLPVEFHDPIDLGGIDDSAAANPRCKRERDEARAGKRPHVRFGRRHRWHDQWSPSISAAARSGIMIS